MIFWGERSFQDAANAYHKLLANENNKSFCLVKQANGNSPDKVRFVMFDTSQLELSLYNGIPHLLFSAISIAIIYIRALLITKSNFLDYKINKVNLC